LADQLADLDPTHLAEQFRDYLEPDAADRAPDSFDLLTLDSAGEDTILRPELVGAIAAIMALSFITVLSGDALAGAGTAGAESAIGSTALALELLQWLTTRYPAAGGLLSFLTIADLIIHLAKRRGRSA
jgi:hypothetical protein